MNSDVPTKSAVTGIKPGRRFFRFDWIFNDAVRSKKRSRLIEVLLRLGLSGDTARRTADKILVEN
jgi:hypothetical protein